MLRKLISISLIDKTSERYKMKFCLKIGWRSRSVTSVVLYKKTEVLSIGNFNLPYKHFWKHQQVEFRLRSGQIFSVCFKTNLDFSVFSRNECFGDIAITISFLPWKLYLGKMLISVARYSIFLKIQIFLPAHYTVIVLYYCFSFSVVGLYKCHIL